jgi:hypothetical protein
MPELRERPNVGPLASELLMRMNCTWSTRLSGRCPVVHGNIALRDQGTWGRGPTGSGRRRAARAICNCNKAAPCLKCLSLPQMCRRGAPVPDKQAGSALTGRAILLAARQLVILLAHADEYTLRHVCLVEHVLNGACTLHISAREDQQAGLVSSVYVPPPA